MKVVAVAILGLTLLCASASARSTGGTTIALVTAEQQNQVLAVDLSSEKVVKRVAVPADPQNVAAAAGILYKVVVVVSPRAGAVTLLDWRTLKTLKVFRGLGSPHLAAISPNGKWAYVTDDARGQLDVIALGTRRIVARVSVGAGAHHLTIGPEGRRAWIALGEHAREISIVDLSNSRRPRLLRRFSPGFTAHDLTFSPDGRRVWVTSGVGDSVFVLDARSGKGVFRVRVGSAPQHVAFSERGAAFITSGYSDRIIKVNQWNGDIVASAKTPHGSFNLSSTGDVVVTSSLLTGEVTEFSGVNLHRMSSVKAARSARGIALTVW